MKTNLSTKEHWEISINLSLIHEKLSRYGNCVKE